VLFSFGDCSLCFSSTLERLLERLRKEKMKVNTSIWIYYERLPNTHTNICTCTCIASLKLWMENVGGKVLIRCLTPPRLSTPLQPSEYIEAVECWCFSFCREGSQAFSITHWNVNYDPGSRTETLGLGGEWEGKYKAAVACAEADSGTEAELSGLRGLREDCDPGPDV